MSDNWRENKLYTESGAFLDISRPNTARIFNYMIGGSAYFDVDRRAAEEMLAVFPAIQKWLRLRHAFRQEAAHSLHDAGYTQFLELAAGIPTSDHPHAFLPGAHIVYSDLNPVAVSYGQSLFGSTPDVDYVYADARKIERLFDAPAVRMLLDRREKIAIGLNGVAAHLTLEENHALAQRLHDWAPAGSCLYGVFQTIDSGTLSTHYNQFLELLAGAGMPFHFYTLSSLRQHFLPWQPQRLEPVSDFLGLPAGFVTEADHGGVNLTFYAAILHKGSEAPEEAAS
jgi:hypothetical protein